VQHANQQIVNTRERRGRGAAGCKGKEQREERTGLPKQHSLQRQLLFQVGRRAADNPQERGAGKELQIAEVASADPDMIMPLVAPAARRDTG
jgi:hypothetical protein